ncbi:MAG: immunoglobulin-like domain-containing protein, partial [Treponemataceae bacterium]
TVIQLDPTDAQAIAAAALPLTPSLNGTDSASFVTGNIVLPAVGLWDTTITWESDKPENISATGVVASSTTDQVVTLTATIRHGTETITKVFTLTVKATGSTAITIALPAAPTATELVFRDAADTTISTFTLTRGSPITVNTSFIGTYDWYVDSGTTSLSSASSCLLDGNDYSLGLHTLLIDAVAGGKAYSGQILFTVVTP